jgi:hypothetical protein
MRAGARTAITIVVCPHISMTIEGAPDGDCLNTCDRGRDIIRLRSASKLRLGTGGNEDAPPFGMMIYTASTWVLPLLLAMKRPMVVSRIFLAMTPPRDWGACCLTP